MSGFPFEAVGVKDFLVHPIEKGLEYTVLAINEDGTKFQGRLADGTLAWFPARVVRIVSGNEDIQRKEYEAQKREDAEKAKRRQDLQMKAQKPQLVQAPQAKQVQVHQVQQQHPKQVPVQSYRSNDDLLSGLLEEISFGGISVDQARKAPSAPQVSTSTSGVYRKIVEHPNGPKYVPNDSLPEQYQSSPSRWQCPSCSTVLSVQTQTCNICGNQKKSEFTIDEKAANSTWKCSSCKVENQAGRATCIMCGTKYKPPPPATNTPGARKNVEQSKSNPQRLVSKKNITSKAGAGIELQYAKGIDPTPRSGAVAIPGHGAGY